ncbi:MAG: DUF3040 domain-containing protein [Streptosporangiaceae bacterium]
MALSMDEERLLAEIERRLADDDPVLAARLTSFRLPRLSLAPRSARARLTASLLMLVVVAAVSVFVYTLMPFRGQNGGNTAAHSTTAPTHPTLSQEQSRNSTQPSIGPSVGTTYFGK